MEPREEIYWWRRWFRLRRRWIEHVNDGFIELAFSLIPLHEIKRQTSNPALLKSEPKQSTQPFLFLLGR